MKTKDIKTQSKNKFDFSLVKQPLKNIAMFALYFFGGFILSLGTVANDLKPFAVSLVAVSKKKGYIFSAIGATLGYFLFGLDTNSARYFFAVIIVCGVALVCEILEFSHIASIPVLASFFACLISGVLINIKMAADLNQYLLTFAESILALGSAYFYYKSINANYKQLRFKALPPSDITCITLSVATLFLSFGHLGFGVVKPFVIIATAIVLFSVRYGGEKWGGSFWNGVWFFFGVLKSEKVVF